MFFQHFWNKVFLNFYDRLCKSQHSSAKLDEIEVGALLMAYRCNRIVVGYILKATSKLDENNEKGEYWIPIEWISHVRLDRLIYNELKSRGIELEKNILYKTDGD